MAEGLLTDWSYASFILNGARSTVEVSGWLDCGNNTSLLQVDDWLEELTQYTKEDDQSNHLQRITKKYGPSCV